jgi:hypothetical protein
MSICPKRGRQMVIHIAFLEETHDGSSRTVAYLKDGRLERSLDCRRREGGGRAAPDLSIRLLEPVCRRSFIHDVVQRLAGGIQPPCHKAPAKMQQRYFCLKQQPRILRLPLPRFGRSE